MLSICFRGIVIHALSRTTPGLIDPKSIRNKNLRLSSVDVCDFQRLSKLLVDIDIIVYLVSSSLPLTSNSNPRGDVNVNLIGALNVLEIAKKENIQKFVFISSGGTYTVSRALFPSLKIIQRIHMFIWDCQTCY